MKNYIENTSSTVIDCYDILDLSLAGGVKDFTDGKYFGNKNISYEKAQENQANWLLDKIKCKKGSKILDIGCGNGRILETAKKRGAKAVGITISKQQIVRNKEKGLDVHLMNYRNIPKDWNNSFDGIIANGSIEHFVQPGDAIKGKQDDIYKEMFSICHRVIRKKGFFATTIIHFNQFVDPYEILKGSKKHNRNTDNFHFSKILLEDFGGWYPIGGQLKKSAKGYFTNEESEDGTEDYHWTSEEWLKISKKELLLNPKVWFLFLLKFIKKPILTLKMLDNLMFSQSWMWQFREKNNGNTPTKLFRDVWKKVD